MGQQVGLGGNVFFHVCMDIQVVGGQVGHNGDMGAPVHGQQLEGAQLHHRPVRGADAVRLAEEWVTDVAPQVDRMPRRLQEAGDDGGGSGLSIAASDAQDGTGADLEENLHLRGEDAAPGPGLLQEAGMQAGGAEDHVVVQSLQVVRTQAQLAARGLQLIPQRAQGLPVLFIASGHVDPRVQQEL